MRALFIASLLVLLASAAEAEDSADEAALIDKAMSAIQENDRRVGVVKARLRKVVINSFKIGTPAPDAAPKRPAPAGTKAQGTLVIDPHPVFVIQWTAHLAGENRRFQISGPHGAETISVDQTGITRHQIRERKALISPWSDAKSYLSQMQYDPREIGFLTLAESVFRLRQLGHVESAKIIERPGGEKLIELRAKSLMPSRSIVIECSSRFNFLPIRLYYVLDNGHVDAITELAYQQVRSEPLPAWFLKSAIRRHASPHQNTSPDDTNWGQTITIEVADLQLDALAPPPRDDERSLPAGTRIHNRIPQPPPAPVPDEPSVRRFWVLGIIVTAVAIVGILLALYAMSMRKSDGSEAA